MSSVKRGCVALSSARFCLLVDGDSCLACTPSVRLTRQEIKQHLLLLKAKTSRVQLLPEKTRQLNIKMRIWWPFSLPTYVKTTYRCQLQLLDSKYCSLIHYLYSIYLHLGLSEIWVSSVDQS